MRLVLAVQFHNCSLHFFNVVCILQVPHIEKSFFCLEAPTTALRPTTVAQTTQGATSKLAIAEI